MALETTETLTRRPEFLQTLFRASFQALSLSQQLFVLVY